MEAAWYTVHMKKLTPKRRGHAKKESELETLSRLVASGFGNMEKRFDKVDGRLDRVEGRLDKVEGRLDKVENQLERVDSRLRRVETEQTETNRLLESFERKQSGLLLSVDEGVHHAEFEKLVKRVDTLEKNRR